MSFKLKPLPFDKSALEPHISERTLSYHYDKHHAGYVSKLNDAVKGSALARKSLEEIILSEPSQSVYNVAAQVWNHDFYWQSLSPEQTRPDTALSDLIDESFKSRSRLEEQFKKAALEEFGSGRAWLYFDQEAGRLAVSSTSDAACPLGSSRLPLLTIDVWEHAYYLDYQNDRADYLEHTLTHLLNWEHADRQLALALETV